MKRTTAESLEGFVDSSYWITLRDEVIEKMAVKYGDVSIPFEYGTKQLSNEQAYYAKVGATIALRTLIKNINRLKRSKAKKAEDYS